jgi:hypothetical protein
MAFEQEIQEALSNILVKGVEFVPNLFVAAVVFLIGYFVSLFLTKLFERILEYIKLEEVFKRNNLEKSLGGNELVPIFTNLFKWYLIFFVIIVSLSFLNLYQLNLFLGPIQVFVHLLFGCALLLISAAIIGQWIQNSILNVHEFFGQQQIASFSKIFVILVAVLISLDTLGFKIQLLNELIVSFFQAIFFGLAIAFGLAFGLGGKEEAAYIIKKFRKSLKL